ncbi:hypothetical protein GIB67_037313, partial [Kingdonia uniflora]
TLVMINIQIFQQRKSFHILGAAEYLTLEVQDCILLEVRSYIHGFQMSESDMAIIKPEAMKSYVWLQTVDGSIQQVEEEVAMFCPMICREVLQSGMGSSKNYAISLPQRVNPSILSLILDYCRFHQVPGRSNKERKSYDEKFIRIDTKRLCELTSAADSLQLKPLVDLTSRALARMIEGKTPEEIRETFHLPDDLTEEEKLEPLRNTADDPRIRLLNRLYARKRKELKEKDKIKDAETEEERVDDRSVDDLLSFINGEDGDERGRTGAANRDDKGVTKAAAAGSIVKEPLEVSFQAIVSFSFLSTGGLFNVSQLLGVIQCPVSSARSATCLLKESRGHRKVVVKVQVQHPNIQSGILSYECTLTITNSAFTVFQSKDSKGVRASKHKKKNRRKKDSSKDLCSTDTAKDNMKDFDALSSICHNGNNGNTLVPSPSRTLKLQDDSFIPKVEFEDDDDDELDPAMKEELDREVEDFARRLNSDWPERMQEILSLGQEGRSTTLSVNGNGSLCRYTKLLCVWSGWTEDKPKKVPLQGMGPNGYNGRHQEDEMSILVSSGIFLNFFVCLFLSGVKF